MKTRTITLLLCIGMIAIAQSQIDRTGDFQPRTFDYAFSASISEMTSAGPHQINNGTSPSVGTEVSFGFEWENTRLLMQLMFHNQVNYFKWTYFQFDYKQETFKNLYVYGGLELAQIKITHPDAHYSTPENYRDVTINPVQLGANLELQYKFLNNHAGIAVQGSMYRAEEQLRPIQKFRKELALALFIYL